MSKRLLILTTLIACGAVVASAQVGFAPIQVNGGYGYSPYRGQPYVYGQGGFGRHSSTVAEGRLRGMADLVRSSGYANLQNSEASINYEQARSAQLDNRVKYAESYYERRRIREEAKAYDSHPVTAEQAHRVAKAQRAKPLALSEYDPSTGTVTWPLALQQPIMNGTRRRIEQLLGERSVTGTFSSETYFELVRLCKVLDEQVNDEIDKLPPQSVSQAKSFLRRLAETVRTSTA